MSPHAKEKCWTAPPHCLHKPQPSHHFGEALCASHLQTPECMLFLLPMWEYCLVHNHFLRMQQLDHHFGEARCELCLRKPSRINRKQLSREVSWDLLSQFLAVTNCAFSYLFIGRIYPFESGFSRFCWPQARLWSRGSIEIVLSMYTLRQSNVAIDNPSIWSMIVTRKPRFSSGIPQPATFDDQTRTKRSYTFIYESTSCYNLPCHCATEPIWCQLVPDHPETRVYCLVDFTVIRMSNASKVTKMNQLWIQSA